MDGCTSGNFLCRPWLLSYAPPSLPETPSRREWIRFGLKCNEIGVLRQNEYLDDCQVFPHRVAGPCIPFAVVAVNLELQHAVIRVHREGLVSPSQPLWSDHVPVTLLPVLILRIDLLEIHLFTSLACVKSGNRHPQSQSQIYTFVSLDEPFFAISSADATVAAVHPSGIRVRPTDL